MQQLRRAASPVKNCPVQTYGCWEEAVSWLLPEVVPRTVSVGFSLAEMQPLHWGGKEKKKKERKNPRRKTSY